MKAVRLYGTHDLRFENVAEAALPSRGDVLLKIGAVGICGSDLHNYEDVSTSSKHFDRPLILGHEFMGEIIAAGEGALDGEQQPLQAGQRVAVEPNCPCYHCEWCEQGHPNLCPNHTFYGAYPTDGALQECLLVKARNCFPIPDSISDGAGALLETLGVALHALDLSKLQLATSVAVIGCGPVGLLVLRLAKLAGASAIYAFDKFAWRAEKAMAWGAAQAWVVDNKHPGDLLRNATQNRGVDVVFEAAWADETIQQAAEMAKPGGTLVLVGIPNDDNLQMSHATARRKGLTIKMARRMKHTYPRAIQLATSGDVNLDDLISHHLPLAETPAAFAKNIAYEEGIHKIIIHPKQ